MTGTTSSRAPASQPPRAPGRRRVPPRIGALLLALAVVAAAAIWIDALGGGDQWQALLGRVSGAIATAVPETSPAPTPRVTTPPTGAPTAEPSATPSATAVPTPTAPPTPVSTPARVPMDVETVRDPEAVFAHELTKTWCAPAGIQIVLAIHGVGDTSAAFQREIAGRVHEFDSYADSHNGGWGPAAIALAIEAYGVPGYEVRVFATRADALRASAVAIAETGAPVVLLAWRGAHVWVMSGYRADADPRFVADAIVSGAYILDPWYPDVSSIWGPSDPPGSFQDAAEMKRNYLPWKRPEGKYPERDGQFIAVIPTIPLRPVP